MSPKFCTAITLSLITSCTFAARFQWTYSNADQWGKHYSKCQPGGQQSPINIDTSSISKKTDERLSAFLLGQPTTITNTGKAIEVNFSANSDDLFRIGNKRYRLQTIRFHSPSENTIDGKHYPLEAQFFARSTSNKQPIILSVMYQTHTFGNPTLKVLWNHLPKRKGQRISLTDSTLRPQSLLPRNLTFYHFTGSLTQPPCTRNISWYVFIRPQVISEEGLQSFQSLYNGNQRPIQALNGREITEST